MAKISGIEKKIDNVKHFNVDLDIGLNEEQVQSRIDDGLVNRIPKHVSKSYGRIFYDNIVNFFNILLITIAILMIIAKVPFTSFAFLVVLIINTVIGLFQDIKARRLTDKLRVASYPMVTVLRSGREYQIPANELVLSDIVVLSLGDQIVADGTVLSGMVEVNESILTGESINVKKTIDGQVLSGTYVTSGKAKVRVDHLGKANYAEKLQASAKYFKKPKSEILRTINLIFKIIGIGVIVLGLALIITYIARGKLNPSNTQEFTIFVGTIAGSLVSMIPSGMYLLVSLTLAVGAIRLANRGMLVQELYCIESLARADVLCLDKTGTITDGSMKVRDLIALEEDSEKLKQILNTLVVSTGDTNVTALAIKNAYDGLEEIPYHSSLPFNSERKISAVMLKDGRSIILGAREFVPHKDKSIDKRCEEIEAKGLRVLVIASYKKIVTPETELSDCQIIGILVLEDHIRDDAISNIKWFQDNGVKIRIISGDSPISVSAIADRVGINEAEKFISLEGMSVEEVKQIANDYVVFGRVSPEQKQAIIESLKENGHTVAMTGDGVNDILALKVADCSIAMASGSDAAKNVSHLVAMNSNFSTLPDVVAEGRRVVNNLQRTCSLFLVKTIFAAFFTFLTLITMWSNPNAQYPFTPNNMYVWELLAIGVGGLFLSLQPNNEKLHHGFLANILTRSVPAAITIVLITMVYFIISFFDTGSFAFDFETATTMTVLTFSFFSFVILFRVCMPIDIYRGALLSAVIMIAMIVFAIDIFVFYPNLNGSGFFNINYKLLTTKNWWIFVTMSLVSIPAYMGLETIFVRIYDKLIKPKNERRLTDNENL